MSPVDRPKRLLEGLHVLDLSRAVAGPYCTMLLGDLGAEVIKVEPPGGDLARVAGLSRVGAEATYFVAMNRNKRSVVVDLQSERGKQVFERLLGWADVVVENFRAGVLDRLGFGHEAIRRVNPRAVVCSISGYGQLGAYRTRKGLDLIGQTFSGLASVTGETDGPPTPAGAPVSDVVTGLNACVAILAALVARERQQAQFPYTVIDLSLMGSTLSMLSIEAASFLNTGKVATRQGGAWFEMFPYDVFPTADGWVAIGSGADWSTLCDVLGEVEDLGQDPALQVMATRISRRVELKARLSARTRTRSTQEWIEALQKEDVLSGPVNDMAQILSDPVVAQQGLLLEMEHPVSGVLRAVGSAPTFWINGVGGESWEKQAVAPPLLGEHTLEVLAELGYADEEARELCDAAAVGFLPS